MKKFIVLAMAVLISGCNLFKKVEKQSTVTEIAIEQGSAKQTKETDTGSTQTSEHWKFKIPVLIGGNTPAFSPQIPNVSNGTSDLKNSMKDLQGENKNLAGTIGYLEGELTRFINAQNGKSKDTNERDTITAKGKEESLDLKKTPVTPWWLIIATAVGAGLVPGIINGIWKKISIKK